MLRQPFNEQLLDLTRATAWEIVHSEDQKLQGHKVHAIVTSKYSRFANVERVDLLQGNNVVASVTAAQVDQFLRFFEAHTYTRATYRNVKNLPLWRNVYGVHQLQFHKNHKLHGLMGVTLDAAACRICRVILPLSTLTIDHQKAQSGGETAAVVRVFRGLGLTLGQPIGAKNQDSVNTNAINVGGSQGVTGQKPDRHTTNLVGAIYYSVCRQSKQLLRVLEESCMQNYLNLRPACGPCNSTLKNQNIF